MEDAGISAAIPMDDRMPVPARDGVIAADRREAIRARELDATPRWYRGWLHLGTTTVIGIVCGTPLLFLVRDLRWWELLVVPLTWIVSNATEWRAHRDLLHKRSRVAPILYDQHTPIHHTIYVTDDMAIRDAREWRVVLIPAYGIALIFVGVLPLLALFWFRGWVNVAALFAATTMFYVVSYEWLHLSYHLPADSRIGRTRIVRTLRRHHAIHHDPRLMQHWNFNVTVPLWDWVRRTAWSPARGFE